MVLMFQDEVAARIISPPSQEEYGFLSVLAQYYCEIERGFRISKNSFLPKPEIESRILRFQFRRDVAIEYEEFTGFLAIAFSHRRKKLRNNLLHGLPVEPQTLDTIFQKIGIQQNDRAENVSPSTYEKLIVALRPVTTSFPTFIPT
jgi:16S rRNA (adenine1518-N6/adenine1519-N6)-dimethyltransferase